MIDAVDIPLGWAILIAILLLIGGGLTLIGCIGLLRLDHFFQRLHAPTLGTTLGTGCVLIASMVFFSVLQSRPVIHELLVAVFMTLTTPITFVLLVRAARYREHAAAAQLRAEQEKE